MKTLVLVGSFVLFVFAISVGAYNWFVTANQEVDQRWAQVQTDYQRRADLVGQMVDTVQGQMKFERETLTQVIEARASATKINFNAADITPENLAQFQQAQQQLSGALSRLLVVVERYPELKTSDAFRDLRTTLEGSENRIAEARRQYNMVCQRYNAGRQQFPSNIVGNMFGFAATRTYFEADQGAEKRPTINLGGR